MELFFMVQQYLRWSQNELDEGNCSTSKNEVGS